MDIAAAMRQDDRRAFAEVLGKHAGIVFKVVNSYASNPDDRADLGQEIAAQLWRAWPGYDPARSLTTWMYRIALNVAISHLRGRSLRERHHVPLEEGLDHAAHLDADADGAGERELLLHRVLAGLDPFDRALLLLHLEDRSHREIAEVLGLGESNVGTRLSRLRQRLRQQQALNLQLATEDRVRRARARLWPLVAGQSVQALAGVAMTVFFARFWIAHLHEPLALACGLLMHAWSVALVASAAMELLLALRINYAKPVLTIQKYLALLRYWRTRIAPLLGLAFWVLWLPLAEVLSEWATGDDIGLHFMAWNLAVGAAGFAGTLWWFRHSNRRASRIADAIDADNAGCGVRDAEALLAEIKAFERP